MSTETGGRLLRGVADLAALGVILLFAILKFYALAPALSDENIYFYMCKRIAEGAIPYRDFFFAHPPLHLLPGSLIIAFSGFSLPLAKAIPAFFAALGGIAIYRAGRRAGPLPGILALVLFLFAYDMLRASSHYTGASEATALLAWALERALAGRADTAGILAAAAALVAFYAVPAGAGIAIWLFIRRTSLANRYLGFYLGTFIIVNLVFIAFFRNDYIDPVFQYHFMKPPAGEGNLAAAVRGIARENVWLLWGAPAAVLSFLVFRRGLTPRDASQRLLMKEPDFVPAKSRWAILSAALLISVLHAAFFMLLGRVYTFYFLPAFPGLALAGGIGYAAALSGPFRSASRGGGRAGPGLLVGLFLAVPILAGGEILHAISFRSPGSGAGEENEVLRSYTWRESPLPPEVDSLVKSVFWREDRTAVGWHLSVTRYLWHESRHFEAPAHLAGRVDELVAPKGTLYGDSIATPLVALLSGRRIAQDHADTNSMRYRSRITPPTDAIQSLEKEPPSAVIAAPSRGFFLVPQMRDWVLSRYRLAETFEDPIYGTYNLYLRR